MTTERELVRALANIFVGNVGRARDVSAVPFGSFTDVEQERALGRARRRHPSIELLDLERLLPRGRIGRGVAANVVVTDDRELCPKALRLFRIGRKDDDRSAEGDGGADPNREGIVPHHIERSWPMTRTENMWRPRIDADRVGSDLVEECKTLARGDRSAPRVERAHVRVVRRCDGQSPCDRGAKIGKRTRCRSRHVVVAPLEAEGGPA